MELAACRERCEHGGRIAAQRAKKEFATSRGRVGKFVGEHWNYAFCMPWLVPTRLLHALAVLASLVALGGCVYVRQEARRGETSGESRARFSVADAAWPDLVPVGLPTYVEEHSQIFKANVTEARVGTTPVEFRITTVRHAGAMGRAWVRWSHAVVENSIQEYPERPSSFEVFYWNPSDVPPEGMVNGCIAGVVPDAGSSRQRAWIDATKRLLIRYDIELPRQRPIRGVVLYGASLGPQFERPVIAELLRRGWAVVMCASATISTDRLLTTVIDLQDGGDEALRAYGVLAAEECDKVLAGYAYGWEVAMEMVERYYPEVPTHPCVMAGFSFGAIMSPPGAARLGDKVDAVVLVGGATNLLGVLTDTPVISFPIRVRDTKAKSGAREVTSGELDRINAVYLEHSKLDGHHTARALAQKPVLMLHAELDGWVPARYGRDLWEQAGRPERWRGPFGHMIMFYFLGHQARPIANWIERETTGVRPRGGGS